MEHRVECDPKLIHGTDTVIQQVIIFFRKIDSIHVLKILTQIFIVFTKSMITHKNNHSVILCICLNRVDDLPYPRICVSDIFQVIFTVAFCADTFWFAFFGSDRIYVSCNSISVKEKWIVRHIKMSINKRWR